MESHTHSERQTTREKTEKRKRETLRNSETMDTWQKGQSVRAREGLCLLGAHPSTCFGVHQPSPAAAAFLHLGTASFAPSQPSSHITVRLASCQAPPSCPEDILTLALAIPSISAVTFCPFPVPHHTAKASFFDIEILHHQL